MTERARSWTLALGAAVVVAIIVANMVRPGPGMEGSWPWAGGLLAFPVSAAVVLSRAPGNTIGRLLGLIAAAAGLDWSLSWISVTYADRPVAAYTESLTTPATIAIFAGILSVLHLFPSGRPLGRWHRYVLFTLAGWAAAGAVLGLLAPGPVGFSQVPNPLAVAPPWTRDVFDAALLGVPVFAAMGVVVLFLRRRQATGAERAQLRWFFAAAAVLAFTMAVALNAPASDDPVEEAIALTLVMLAFWSVPAAIVVAIVRYHLYDIDRILSRTVTYVVVAGVLTAVYATCIVLVQSLLSSDSAVAVAASTLAAAALFAPVRTRVQERLDRRFNRARYEASAVTQQFARRLQQQIDLHAIEADLLAAVGRTLQPHAVQLWLAGSAGHVSAQK